MHSGLDLMAPEGTQILAARPGRVLYTGDGFRGYGNMVILDHGDGFVTVYAHAKKLLVHAEDQVAAGQVIALVGQTGNATAPHLHFEIREGDRALDPLPFLDPVATARAGAPLALAPAGQTTDSLPVEQ